MSITRQSGAKKAVQDSRQFLEAAPDAIVIVNPRGEIVYVNTQTQKLFGYEKDDLIGNTIEVLVPERLRGEHMRHRQEYAVEPRVRPMGSGLELHAVRKDGTEFPVEISLSPIKTEEGILFASAIRDVTERKKLDQMKTDFVSFASHQLKTPLAEISGFIENMLSGLGGKLSDKHVQYLRAMEEIGKNSIRLVSDLLEVSKIERGMLEAECLPCCLNDLVKDVVSHYRREVKAKGLDLIFKETEKPVQVFCDLQKTAEAIKNIVENAVKFTDRGSIAVTLKSDPEQGIVEIKDTGTGIEESRMKRLFTRELILDDTTSKRGGSGLGLYIAKNFMKIQGGDIQVHSAAGEGTKFVLTLPLHAEFRTGRNSKKTAPSRPAPEKTQKSSSLACG